MAGKWGRIRWPAGANWPVVGFVYQKGDDDNSWFVGVDDYPAFDVTTKAAVVPDPGPTISNSHAEVFTYFQDASNPFPYFANMSAGFDEGVTSITPTFTFDLDEGNEMVAFVFVEIDTDLISPNWDGWTEVDSWDDATGDRDSRVYMVTKTIGPGESAPTWTGFSTTNGLAWVTTALPPGTYEPFVAEFIDDGAFDTNHVFDDGRGASGTLFISEADPPYGDRFLVMASKV